MLKKLIVMFFLLAAPMMASADFDGGTWEITEVRQSSGGGVAAGTWQVNASGIVGNETTAITFQITGIKDMRAVETVKNSISSATFQITVDGNSAYATLKMKGTYLTFYISPTGDGVSNGGDGIFAEVADEVFGQVPVGGEMVVGSKAFDSAFTRIAATEHQDETTFTDSGSNLSDILKSVMPGTTRLRLIKRGASGARTASGTVVTSGDWTFIKQ